MSWQTQKMWDRLNECRKQVLGGIQYFRNLFHFRSLCFFMIVAWILLCWTFVAINIPTDASALCFFKGIVLGHLVNIYNTLACVGLEEEHLFCRVIICYFFSQFMDGWINEWTYWAQSGALDTGHKTNTKQMTSVTPKQPGTQLSAEPQQIVTKQTIKCRHTCAKRIVQTTTTGHVLSTKRELRLWVSIYYAGSRSGHIISAQKYTAYR